MVKRLNVSTKAILSLVICMQMTIFSSHAHFKSYELCHEKEEHEMGYGLRCVGADNKKNI